MEALDRLHYNHIYPIVLLIKFKSVKQIKEIKDPRYSEKISQKDAKNMFESTQALEADYKPFISGIALISLRIKRLNNSSKPFQPKVATK